MKVLVLGGRGFIGGNIVKSLNEKGANVFVGSRKVLIMPTIITLQMHKMLDIDNWQPILEGFDVVINAIGILRERKGESYNAVHAEAPAALAKACAELDVRLVHISAIGLNMQAKSRFVRSKYLGEQAILHSGANAVIARVSLLDGQGGYGAKWFRRVAKWPLQFVMQSNGLIAPLQVVDLGEAVASLVMNNVKTPRIIELGGIEVMSIPDYLQLLRFRFGKGKATQIAVPKFLVRIASHMFDVLAWTPLSFGHFELMQGYNVPAKNWLPNLLGRPPALVGATATVFVNKPTFNPMSC